MEKNLSIEQRVELIHAEFEGYDRPLDSKVRNPAKYGVMLTPKARMLIGECETRNKGLINFSARIPVDFIEPDKFKKMLDACGYASQKAWIMQCYKRLECEYAARTKEKSHAPKDATQSKK